VYAPVGLPWQDLAIAWLAYRRAELDDVGRGIDLPAGASSADRSRRSGERRIRWQAQGIPSSPPDRSAGPGSGVVAARQGSYI
jgi:hypothetical protein